MLPICKRSPYRLKNNYFLVVSSLCTMKICMWMYVARVLFVVGFYYSRYYFLSLACRAVSKILSFSSKSLALFASKTIFRRIETPRDHRIRKHITHKNLPCVFSAKLPSSPPLLVTVITTRLRLVTLMRSVFALFDVPRAFVLFGGLLLGWPDDERTHHSVSQRVRRT